MTRTQSNGSNLRTVIRSSILKVVTHYAPYRDFAGVKFPSKIIQYQDGLMTLNLTITAVRANLPVDIEVPAQVRRPGAGEIRRWRMGSGTSLAFRRTAFSSR